MNDILTAAAAYSSPLFNEMMPYGYFIIGLSVAPLAIWFIINAAIGAFTYLTGYGMPIGANRFVDKHSDGSFHMHTWGKPDRY